MKTQFKIGLLPVVEKCLELCPQNCKYGWLDSEGYDLCPNFIDWRVGFRSFSYTNELKLVFWPPLPVIGWERVTELSILFPCARSINKNSSSHYEISHLLELKSSFDITCSFWEPYYYSCNFHAIVPGKIAYRRITEFFCVSLCRL